MAQRKLPQRMCIGCQTMIDKKEMLRIVRTPDGKVEFDPTGKKSGRGAYICAKEECFQAAYKQKRLERSLRQVISPEIYEILRQQLQDKDI